MGTIDAHSIVKRFTRVGLFILLGVLPTSAQVDKKCSGRVYGSREVTKPARIIEGPKLNVGLFDPVARARFVLEAVLCRSGQVTDIRVIEGVSPEINKFAIAAITLVKFEPAELRWHSVSQRMSFELEFGPNEPGMQVRTSADSAGRLVESVDVIGNRRLTAKQIFFWIETRPGDRYSEEQLKRDFEAVLASGYFDKTQTRVTIEDAIRGGVAVVFFVVELPLIGEINFEGLKVERSKVIEALKKEKVNLQPETPYDVESVKKAVRVIKLLLASTGLGNVNVETRNEHVTAMKVNITFVITPNQ